MRRRSGNSILDWASFFTERKEAERQRKRELARRQMYDKIAESEGWPTGLDPEVYQKLLIAKYKKSDEKPKDQEITEADIQKLVAIGDQFFPGGEEGKQAAVTKAFSPLLRDKYGYEPSEVAPTIPTPAAKPGLSKYLRPFLKGMGQGALSRSPVIINESPITKALGKAKEKETAGNVEMESPNGQRFTVDQSEVEEAKKHGWKVVGESKGRTQLPIFMGVGTKTKPSMF